MIVLPRYLEILTIRNQVVNLLLDLGGLLEDAIAIITGEEPSWDQISTDGGVFLDHDDDDSDSPDTELEQISMDVADVVNCLLRLSVAIRNPAPHDRFVESHSTDTSHYERFDIEHVYSKFESLDRDLAERLGKAISRRRQFFKYREAHRRKLPHGLDYHYPGDAETIASSLPEHLKDKIGTGQVSRLPVIEGNYSDAGVSQTSYATSVADTEQRRVPPLPADASKGPFECPFCFTIIAVSDRSSWKKHVYGDLRPYSHVGRHQQQLALFALPELEPNDESDPSDEEASDAECIAARSDSSKIHRNEDAPTQDPPPVSTTREIPARPEIPNSGRQKEYFVPRDGIDREVISADICLYLGNDALVRPGHYEAMIEDLKADSARWDSERRWKTAPHPGGVVLHRDSETHQSRQANGPTEDFNQAPPNPRNIYDRMDRSQSSHTGQQNDPFPHPSAPERNFYPRWG
ncbi:hypothetical protein CEP54_003555 [Fusarium duplospermum]|uniref:Oxidoreductase acuF-like C2H2 type zinc-finger domain-containing protein n=1 Tax=Fusarium duplospermum TaxID=1325734 RepID=A0A428QN95_9HYPO|nr:hypothetical protein CEP54_003555 [Fusarium duplospermum]